MFSLIITIISIALVAALALATIFYGGQIFQNSKEKTATMQTLQQGTQITGALELYKADHGSIAAGTSAEIQATLLTEDYLKSWPSDSWQLQNGYAVQTGLTLESCTAINAKMGISSVPTCNDPAFAGKSFCCSTN